MKAYCDLKASQTGDFFELLTHSHVTALKYGGRRSSAPCFANNIDMKSRRRNEFAPTGVCGPNTPGSRCVPLLFSSAICEVTSLL
jgi:hypothetical protein